MEIKRDYYLNKLIQHRKNGLVKIVTGVRRCGKSYLLFKLFRDHLLKSGIKDDHIISVALDDYGTGSFSIPMSFTVMSRAASLTMGIIISCSMKFNL